MTRKALWIVVVLVVVLLPAVLAGGAPNRVLNLSGVVDVHFTSDWYSEEAELEYRPIHVSSGSLKVRYKFLPWYPTDPI